MADNQGAMNRPADYRVRLQAARCGSLIIALTASRLASAPPYQWEQILREFEARAVSAAVR